MGENQLNQLHTAAGKRHDWHDYVLPIGYHRIHGADILMLRKIGFLLMGSMEHHFSSSIHGSVMGIRMYPADPGSKQSEESGKIRFQAAKLAEALALTYSVLNCTCPTIHLGIKDCKGLSEKGISMCIYIYIKLTIPNNALYLGK